MVSISCFEIFEYWLAHCNAFLKSISEIDGYMETTSKEMNFWLCLFGMLLNQEMTESELIHCWNLVLLLTSLIILERICLEMTCRSGLVGFISLIEGSSWKCGLWSFRVALAGRTWVAIILSSRMIQVVPWHSGGIPTLSFIFHCPVSWLRKAVRKLCFI